MRTCAQCLQPVEDDARFCGGCGAACGAAAPPADPFVGRTVSGKFKVEALIGQGGMGKVYRARHLTLDRAVVLKMLHPAYSEDPQISQRFQREARAASRLNHPNSIAVLDFGAAEDGTLFMAMEYLPGRDLGRVISEGWPLPEGRIIRIGAQILSALAEAHAQGIIHRDLKPENVMVEPRRDEPDFVKVLDFGIAKITAGADEPRLTAVGLVCGTPEYMSPEQARGAELDPRSDLYSVGVILYQLATGDLPFHSDTPVGFLTKHLSEVPAPPRQLRPDLSEPLDALIRRSMEKDPARRFPDATAMREALLACAVPAAVAPPVMVAPVPGPAAAGTRVAVPLQAPPRPQRAGRYRAPLLLGGLAVLVGVGAAAWLLTGQRGGGGIEITPRPVAAAPAAAAPPPAADVPPRPPPPPTSPPPSPAGGAPATAAVPTPAPRPPPRPPQGAPPSAEAAAEPAAGLPGHAGPLRRARAHELARRGDALRAAGDVEGAIRAYLVAERADPGLATLQKRLAICYQQQGDTPSARERYRRYLATDPPDADRIRLILENLK